MKKSLITFLFAATTGLVACNNKENNAANEIKKAFPELRDATEKVMPSIDGEFGILIQDKFHPSVIAYITGTDLDGDKNLQNNEVNKTYISVMDVRETHNRGVIASFKEGEKYHTVTEPVNAPELPFDKLVPLGTKIPRHAFYLHNTSLQNNFSESVQDLATNGIKMLAEEKERWSEEIKQPAMPTPTYSSPVVH